MTTAGPTAAESVASSSSRFVYFYLMTSEHDAVRRLAPAHADYWNQLHLPGYAGGPFTDRSGGLITFLAHDYRQARSLVGADPFAQEGLLESRWLKQWDAHSADVDDRVSAERRPDMVQPGP